MSVAQQRCFGDYFHHRCTRIAGHSVVILESIIDQRKNISQIEHTRHRSLGSFMANMVGGLIAYCHPPKKPSLHLDQQLLLDPLIQT